MLVISRAAMCGLFACLVVGTASPVLAIEIQPGLWRSTETGLEDGQPVPPETDEDCISPEQAKDPMGLMDKEFKEFRDQCQTFDVKDSGNRLTMRIRCGDGKQFAMDMDAAFTFHSPQHYTGTMKAKMMMMGNTSTSDKKIEARRVGVCKPEQR